MRCSTCSHNNPKGTKFCGECGAPLVNRCPQCSTDNPISSRFCYQCGVALQSASLAEPISSRAASSFNAGTLQPADATASLPEAERRQLTVMFCDLVGSTPLAEQLDPEDLLRVLDDYRQVCARVVRRFDGHIAKYMGDGMLVYFGYPQAHEDDAWRAVQAGLGMVDAMRGLNVRLQQSDGVELKTRVGIHTGLVVAGDMGLGEQFEARAIVGQTPNIAARLEAFAEPGMVVISGATYHLVQGYFDCEDLGTPTLKGISQPISVYRVLHESTARSRLEAAALRGLTPLVGRRREVSLLGERWRQAQAGMGQAVLLTGEAGIGKSRLVRVIEEQVARDSRGWLTACHCSPFYQNSAFYPVIDLLERVVLRFEREDGPAEKLGKLEGFLTQYGMALEEAVPLFTSLLSIPPGEQYPPLDMNPMHQKQKTQEALARLLFMRASQQPVLFVVEDLHWADPSTLELLSLLLEQVHTTRLLAVFTSRVDIEFHPTNEAFLRRMTLSRLPQEEVEVIVARVAGGKPLPPEVLRQVVRKTDGVPLFVEEFTKMLLESGQLQEREDRYELTEALPALAIPTTLQDSLMARLDRVTGVKTVAQLGATLGREFSYELLQAVSPFEEEALREDLEQLVEAEILYQRGVLPQATFQFKHALIQDAAYDSLLKSTRQQYHQKIAQALIDQLAEEVENSPELLAHHYTEAGLIEQAIPLWQQAGQRALQRSANLEAVAHLTRGVELLKLLPESDERVHQELDLLTAFGPALIASRGFADPEVGRTYGRAREICRQLGDTPQLFLVLWGLFTYYIVRVELKTSRDLGEQLLRLAENAGDPELLLQAHVALGANLFFLGKFGQAREHLEQGLSHYRAEEHGPLAYKFGQETGAVGEFYQALCLWQQGYPDQALGTVRQALAFAEQARFSSTIAQIISVVALVRLLRGEWSEASESAASAMRYATEHVQPMWVAYGTLFHGFALAKMGQTEQGIAQLQQGLAIWHSTGAEISRSTFLSFIAEAHREAGDPDRGLPVVAEALETISRTGEQWLAADLYRVQGELLLKHDPPDVPQAEIHLRHALEVARQQQARSLELRAGASLARLLQQQGKTQEARSLLAPIYEGFTEGFTTLDLVTARALLDQLAPSDGEPTTAVVAPGVVKPIRRTRTPRH